MQKLNNLNIKKKLFCLLSVLFILFSSIGVVNAYSNVPIPYGGTFKEGSLKYWVAYSFGISDVAIGSSYVREPTYSYKILMSDAPIVLSGSKFISPNGTKYIVTGDYYRLDKSAYYGQSSYNIQNGSLSYDQYGVPPTPPSVNANHTIKNTDGSDFFTAPPQPDVTLVGEGQKLLQMILMIVGLTICLVVLVIFLRKLARALKASLSF